MLKVPEWKMWRLGIRRLTARGGILGPGIDPVSLLPCVHSSLMSLCCRICSTVHGRLSCDSYTLTYLGPGRLLDLALATVLSRSAAAGHVRQPQPEVLLLLCGRSRIVTAYVGGVFYFPGGMGEACGGNVFALSRRFLPRRRTSPGATTPPASVSCMFRIRR